MGKQSNRVIQWRIATILMIAFLIIVILYWNRRSEPPETVIFNEPEVYHMLLAKVDANQDEMMRSIKVEHSVTIHSTKADKFNVTVITAYWNIGNVTNGVENQAKSPSKYLAYADSFRYIENPVVAYFDDKIMMEHFLKVRKECKYPTKVLLLDRSQLWGFKIEPQIARIYVDPSYPKKFPNFHSLYNCANHVKYDLMPFTHHINPFATEFFAWLDLGYFRDMPAGLPSYYNFQLTVPQDLDTLKVAYTEVSDRNDQLPISDIFRNCYFWVAGGMFIGRGELLRLISSDYKYHTELFLQNGLANTDQQILYSMYSSRNPNRPRVNLQTYRWDGSTYDEWMYLGEMLRNLWWIRVPIPSDCVACDRKSDLIPFFS